MSAQKIADFLLKLIAYHDKYAPVVLATLKQFVVLLQSGGAAGLFSMLGIPAP